MQSWLLGGLPVRAQEQRSALFNRTFVGEIVRGSCGHRVVEVVAVVDAVERKDNEGQWLICRKSSTTSRN